jgi:hypothetical protein
MSLFRHVTVVPGLTVMLEGEKAEFFIVTVLVSTVSSDDWLLGLFLLVVVEESSRLPQ